MDFLNFQESTWTAFWLWADRISILAFYFIPIIAYIWRKRIKRWWRNNDFKSLSHRSDIESHWDGLILLPSNKDVPIKLLNKVAPKILGIIITPYGKPYCDNLIQEATEKKIKLISINIDEPDNVNVIKAATHNLIHQLKVHETKSLCVDVTGGKSTMSIAMFMAAEEARLESVYLDAQWDSSAMIKQTSFLVLISNPNA